MIPRCWLLFPVTEDEDVAVFDGEDVRAWLGPAGWVLAGPWCACWRGGGQSVVISVMAARALCSSTMFLRLAQAATRAWVAMLLTALAGGVVDEGGGVVAEQGVGPAGQFQVVGDVPGGLLGGHGGHGIAQGDPLVQGGQDAEAEHAAQGGLADEQAGERAGGVHLGVGQDADGLELAVGQKMSLVEDQHGGDRLQQLRAVLPCEVQVTSRAHPLFGQRLKASRFSRRGGALNLVVELPDGAPGMIRADATDVLGTVNAEGLAVVMDAEGLRHLRDLVRALGRKTAGLAGGTAGAGR
jgi:hypothetical protein